MLGELRRILGATLRAIDTLVVSDTMCSSSSMHKAIKRGLLLAVVLSLTFVVPAHIFQRCTPVLALSTRYAEDKMNAACSAVKAFDSRVYCIRCMDAPFTVCEQRRGCDHCSCHLRSLLRLLRSFLFVELLRTHAACYSSTTVRAIRCSRASRPSLKLATLS